MTEESAGMENFDRAVGRKTDGQKESRRQDAGGRESRMLKIPAGGNGSCVRGCDSVHKNENVICGFLEARLPGPPV